LLDDFGPNTQPKNNDRTHESTINKGDRSHASTVQPICRVIDERLDDVCEEYCEQKYDERSTTEVDEGQSPCKDQRGRQNGNGPAINEAHNNLELQSECQQELRAGRVKNSGCQEGLAA